MRAWMHALRVMSFNLRRDVESDGANAWRHRRDAAAALVREVAPHVLGTQELLPHQLGDLDARLPGYARVGGCRRGTGEDEHNALHYRVDRLELVEAGDVWLSETPEVPASRSWGNELPRMATWARLRERASGVEATFVNTHLDHRSESSRLRAAAFLARRFPEAVLMGDFNAQPHGNVHATFLLAGFSDAGADSTGGTYHAFTGFGRDRIDWILAPPGARVADHRILRERPQGRCPSDHDPIVAELDLAPVRRVPVTVEPRAAAPALRVERE